MPVELSYQTYGDETNPAILFVHGFLGSAWNWLTTAGLFSQWFRVVIPDLRNHGKSPHSDNMSYQEIAEDLRHLMKNLGIKKASLVGHSMGGKACMFLAGMYPRLIEKMIIEDISPRTYSVERFEFLKTIASMDFRHLNRRSEIDLLFQKVVPDLNIRIMLLKNLQRTTEGFFWKSNVDALVNCLHQIVAGVDEGLRILCPTLFIRGENSPYITDIDTPYLQKHFENYEIITISKAGHWVHSDQKDQFQKEVLRFL